MIYIVCILFLLLVLLYFKCAKFCVNPYVLYCVVGSKGSGKSLFLSQFANDWVKNHKGDVFSNMDIGFPLSDKYWEDSYPYGSLILIDEIGVLHPDRNFKTFPQDCMEWYKMSRKRGLTIVCSSQTMDFDKKIRMLCDRLFVCSRHSWFTFAVPYQACISTVETPDGGHDLVNDVRKAGLPKVLIIPRIVHDANRLGYQTEQIIKKDASAH